MKNGDGDRKMSDINEIPRNPEPPRRYSTVMFRGKPASVVSPTGYYPSGHLDLMAWDGDCRQRFQAVPHGGRDGWTRPGVAPST
jgi:hypothetical protein